MVYADEKNNKIYCDFLENSAISDLELVNQDCLQNFCIQSDQFMIILRSFSGFELQNL